MDGNDVSCDQIIAELVDMGFDISDITEAINAVGSSLDNAIEFIVNDTNRKHRGASTSSDCPKNNKVLGKRATSSLLSSTKMRQQNIIEYMNLRSGPKRSKTRGLMDASVSRTNFVIRHAEHPVVSSIMKTSSDICLETIMEPLTGKDDNSGGFDWEKRVNNLIHKHFGFSSLKGFQKEVLAAWLGHQDCLILSATGSGKSLCFQVPALLSGKAVVVISPLISLMHDQCLKLGKHGISACFLGSGQIDKTVEKKAMSGAYNIIYVCPETILRLIKPLQSLAESHGIALFAIDEVHCVSKWGHDFRPSYRDTTLLSFVCKFASMLYSNRTGVCLNCMYHAGQNCLLMMCFVLYRYGDTHIHTCHIRRLSVLRENFSADNLKFLKFDIPLMALTATATIPVREDILKSLCMSEQTKIVITSFFRPNLRLSVKHSRTSSLSSYEKDFSELIRLYTRNQKSIQQMISKDLENFSKNSSGASHGSASGPDEMYTTAINDVDDYGVSDDGGFLASSNEEELSVQYLEADCDQVREVDDLDVSCGEFSGQPPVNFSNCGTPDFQNVVREAEGRPPLHRGHLEGPTIIYVPTRKETLNLTKFLSRFGVKVAAYNAKLPKSHLRQVHKEFQEDNLQVVVATVAFGLGIDKSNVRRIIHYGWPQSLDAYYQEAGRAGRDGKLADCVLYANLSRVPTLLPCQRSDEQTEQAYKMLSDCFRYGMNTSCCRAKMLVEYFGEEFSREKCLLCDVCTNGPPEIQDLKVEATSFLQLIVTHYGNRNCQDISCDDDAINNLQGILMESPNIRAFVSRIREQNHAFATNDLIWWRGLARILEDKGFIRDGGDMTRVQIKFPEPTASGVQFLKSEFDIPFHVYPEADMLLSMNSSKSYSSFSEWGKGWADPEIRRQRLDRRKTWRKPRKRKPCKHQRDLSTVRGRLSAKLSKRTDRKIW